MSQRDWDDQALVAGLRRGDDEAVAEVFRRHGGRVKHYLHKRFPSLEEEAIYDVLVDAVIAVRETFDQERGTLGAWILLLAHQRAVRLLRQEARPWPTLAGDLVGGTAATQEPPGWLDQERADAVREALQGLSPLERAVMEADLEQEEPCVAEELARRLNVTPQAVYGARARARRKLRQRLRHWFPGLQGSAE